MEKRASMKINITVNGINGKLRTVCARYNTNARGINIYVYSINRSTKRGESIFIRIKTISAIGNIKNNFSDRLSVFRIIITDMGNITTQTRRGNIPMDTNSLEPLIPLRMAMPIVEASSNMLPNKPSNNL